MHESDARALKRISTWVFQYSSIQREIEEREWEADGSGLGLGLEAFDHGLTNMVHTEISRFEFGERVCCFFVGAPLDSDGRVLVK